MGKTGEVKTGESLTGDSAATAINAPVQSWSLDAPTPTVEQISNLNAPVQDWQFAGIGVSQNKTGETKTGEGPTGGGGGAFATIENSSTVLNAPAQTWSLDAPTPTVKQIAQLESEVQTWSFDAQPAALDAVGTVELGAAAQQWTWDGLSGQVGFPVWVIDDTAIRVTSVTLTPTTLTLEVRARTADERALLDALDSDAGAVQSRERADGTVAGLDTAAGSNTFEVIPPIRHLPQRATRDWLVDDVSRDRTSADTQATSATVSLVAADTRDAVTGYTETFDFSAGGTVVTRRVSGISQGATTSLTITAEPRQAELIETVTAATAGAVVREVPDGQLFTEDTTPNSRQTVDITPPSGAADPAIPQDTYVISNWESRGDDGGAYRITLEIDTRF